jgi:hypothetical protein
METIDTIELENGRVARIVHDQDCSAPYGDDDYSLRIVWLHRRYSDPAKGACGKTPDEVAAWSKANAKAWFVTPLWMYDHSGIALGVGERNPFHCPWDSGRIGIVALRRDEWGPKSQVKYLETAQTIVETYAQWCNGECYGYRIEEDGEEIDSCYGFIGMDAVRERIEEVRTVWATQPREADMKALSEGIASALL